MIRRMAAHRFGCVAVVISLMAMPEAAHAAILVAEKHVALCRSLAELEAFEALLAAKDRTGAELYLKGAQPPCMLLATGETVEQLDQNGAYIQVVTRKGVPRFIGWGRERWFKKP